MAMTYSDAQISIEQNNWFKHRVRQSTSIYVNYLLNTPEADPDYDAKIALASRISSQADTIINSLMFTLSGDSEVLQAGPAIPDAQLQLIVEKTINKGYPLPPAPAMEGMMTMPPPKMRYLPPRPQEPPVQ